MNWKGARTVTEESRLAANEPKERTLLKRLEFELFSLRQRFRRQEIDRQDCVERINQLVMDFVIGTGELDQEDL